MRRARAAFTTHGCGELLAIAGGRERALHDMESRPDAPPTPEAREALARALHVTKNAEYARILAQGEIVLRPGVRDLMHECRARGLRMGITTTTSRENIDALLGRQLAPEWRDWFDVVLAGEGSASVGVLNVPEARLPQRSLR